MNPSFDQLLACENPHEAIGDLIDTDPLAVRDLLEEAINRLAALPSPLGLIVVLKNGEDHSLASRYIHSDDAAIDEAVERARNVIAANPDQFRPETEIAIGEISIREVGR